MILRTVFKQGFDFFSGKPIEVQPVEEHLSTDAGLLPIRQWDEKLAYTEGFANQLHDPRFGSTHSFLEMTRSRIFGIIAGYEDQNDHDFLRSDAIFKLIADRSPDDNDLASQPTISRFENSISPASLLRLEEWFLSRFQQSFDVPPSHVTLDIDTFDDPTHGGQQLTFFHGHYDQYQYQVRVMTCADNDQVILPVLLHGTASVTLGAHEDLQRTVSALRQQSPDVHVHFRADSGFAAPRMYETCEALRIDYTIGLKMNPVLQRESDALLEQAVADYAETDEPQRLFTAFEYQARSWSRPRWVIIKCEANSEGTNRRAVVTNRPGARVLPEAAYDEYADRGESENRNKELKCELSADRLSDHRYMANCFRMFLHCTAYNLLVSLRRLVALPAEETTPLPAESLSGRARRQFFNNRRRNDPLGEAHASTWRMRLIKVAAMVQVRARRVIVNLSGSWPFLDHYEAVSRAVTSFGTG